MIEDQSVEQAAEVAAPVGEAAVEGRPEETTAPTEEAVSLWSNDDKPVDAVDGDAPPAAEVVEEVPEWFMKDKYKTVEDQAKSAFELQKKMGKNWGAPQEDYKLEGIEGIQQGDPLLEHLAPAIKELGLSQDGFNQLVKSYQDANIKLGDMIEQQVAKELTASDALTVKAVDGWMKDSFSKQERETMQSWITSVDDFKVLNSLRTLIPAKSSVPSSTQGQATTYESSRDIESQMLQYKKDVASGSRAKDKSYSDSMFQRRKDALVRESKS
jgi:hypothetical protein